MPHPASGSNDASKIGSTDSNSSNIPAGNRWHWPTTPQPIKRLFDRFPLRIYSANELPQRSARRLTRHALCVFTTSEDATLGSPSFNPSCLKWQAYLKFSDIAFDTIPSNNHASPTGVLPFLLPSVDHESPTLKTLSPIPSNKLENWTHSVNESYKEPSSMRYEAYMSLLDFRIRNAWLYTLYLEPSNFDSIAYRLYLMPCSSSAPVRAYLAHGLRAAAETELLKHAALIDAEFLDRESDKAFSALSTLLSDDKYFFSAEKPGLFDASLFAYTHLLLDTNLGWQENRMVRTLEKYGNLIEHRQRIYDRFFARDSKS